MIKALDQAVNKLKKHYSFKRFQVVGYSGGSTIACLLSAWRNDITALITFAGNLNPQAWTQQHHPPPLKGSLNPVDFAPTLKNIPQIHFVGDDETTVIGTASYLKSLGTLNKVTVISLPLGHQGAWEDVWSRFLAFNRATLPTLLPLRIWVPASWAFKALLPGFSPFTT